MTLTFLELYNECAEQPWSMYDGEAESIDDLESALKISINKAISYLWNFQPWSFRKQRISIKTKSGKNIYNLPNGLLERKVIEGEQKFKVIYDRKFLDYIPDFEMLEDSEGEPEGFYVDGESLLLYPTPDDSYTINISYLVLPYGLNDDEDAVYELKEETDYINIPEKYETLFKNCVISLAMMYAIADETDENYSGYKKQYEDALDVMLKYCLNRIADRNFVW